MIIECPNCEQDVNVESEDLPERACDDMEIDCGKCGHTFSIGWYAELEIRD
jgi:predicted Zn finger-like uncharacterized protein